MSALTDREKAIIMLGTASLMTADSLGHDPNERELIFAEKIKRIICPNKIAMQLLDIFFINPTCAYKSISSSLDEHKRIMKAIFVHTCTCDGPINEEEQAGLDFIDTLCNIPKMDMSEIDKVYLEFTSLYNDNENSSEYKVDKIRLLEIYHNLCCTSEVNYEELIALTLTTRLKDRVRDVGALKDRGNRFRHYQLFSYDINKMYNLVYSHIENESFFPSMYLDWLLFEIGAITNPTGMFYTLRLLLKDGLYQKIIEKNRYECYGFCQSILVILDLYYPKRNGLNLLSHVKLAINGIVTYLYYHKGINILWDTELYSSYARIFDLFIDYSQTILWTNGAGSFPLYSYCYGMYEAYECAPIEHPYKIEYWKNVLMMQQNQTVGGVTGDAMEAKLDKAILCGKQQFDVLTISMLKS